MPSIYQLASLIMTPISSVYNMCTVKQAVKVDPNSEQQFRANVDKMTELPVTISKFVNDFIATLPLAKDGKNVIRVKQDDIGDKDAYCCGSFDKWKFVVLVLDVKLVKEIERELKSYSEDIAKLQGSLERIKVHGPKSAGNTAVTENEVKSGIRQREFISKMNSYFYVMTNAVYSVYLDTDKQKQDLVYRDSLIQIGGYTFTALTMWFGAPLYSAGISGGALVHTVSCVAAKFFNFIVNEKNGSSEGIDFALDRNVGMVNGLAKSPLSNGGEIVLGKKRERNRLIRKNYEAVLADLTKKFPDSNWSFIAKDVSLWIIHNFLLDTDGNNLQDSTTSNLSSRIATFRAMSDPNLMKSHSK